MLQDGAGADQMDGNHGIDTVSYAGSSTVTVNLASGGLGGDAQGDTYFGIENVIGSSSDDVIIGDIFSNRLDGGAVFPEPCWNGDSGNFLTMRLRMSPYEDWNVAFLLTEERWCAVLGLPRHPNQDSLLFQSLRRIPARRDGAYGRDQAGVRAHPRLRGVRQQAGSTQADDP
jgi:hypothetical protein